MKKKLECVYCLKDCGIQMVCEECFEKYRQGLMPPISRVVEMREEMDKHIERQSREDWVALFFTAALMGLAWWLFCVIWMGR